MTPSADFSNPLTCAARLDQIKRLIAYFLDQFLDNVDGFRRKFAQCLGAVLQSRARPAFGIICH